MHPGKVAVWCRLWAGGIIGPQFCKDAANPNVTVNGERYREIISNSFFFLSKLKELDQHDMWFQQDGATCHKPRVTMDLLREARSMNILYFISRSRQVNWPPRSCDITPLEQFLWGYIKAHVYTNKIRKITAEILEGPCQNWSLHKTIFKY